MTIGPQLRAVQAPRAIVLGCDISMLIYRQYIGMGQISMLIYCRYLGVGNILRPSYGQVLQKTTKLDV